MRPYREATTSNRSTADIRYHIHELNSQLLNPDNHPRRTLSALWSYRPVSNLLLVLGIVAVIATVIHGCQDQPAHATVPHINPTTTTTR